MLRATIAVLLLFCASAHSQETPKSPEIKIEQQSDGAAKSQTKTETQTSTTQPIATVEQPHATKNPEWKTDYEAQKRAEEASEYSVFFKHRLKITDALLALFTLLLVIVGAVQGIFLFRTDRGTHKAADAAKESADVANKTLIAAQRPWIYPGVSVGSDFVLNDEGAQITFRYILKNSGNTPATNVDVAVRFFALQFGRMSGEPPNRKVDVQPTDAAAKLIELCEEAAESSELMAKSNWLAGDPIFPNIDLMSGVTITIPRAEIDAARDQNAHKLLIPVLLFCIAYRFPTDTKSHYTGLIFQLFRHDPASEGGARGFTVDDLLVPQAELVLMPNPFRSGVAN